MLYPPFSDYSDIQLFLFEELHDSFLVFDGIAFSFSTCLVKIRYNVLTINSKSVAHATH